MIKAIPISTLSGKNDSLHWTLDKKYCFTIKYAYNSTIPPRSSIYLIKVSWKKLWKILVPYKYKMLLWNVCHSILPIAQTLSLKLFSFDPICI